MRNVFISYAREDAAAAHSLARALSADGFNIVMDTRIETGVDWETWIYAQIDKVELVIVLWSASSVTSSWVKKEALYAYTRGKLLQARLDRETPPPTPFAARQAADLDGYSGGQGHFGYIELRTALTKRFMSNDDLAAPAVIEQSRALLAAFLGAFGYRDRILSALDRLERNVEGPPNPRLRAHERALSYNFLALCMIFAVATPPLALSAYILATGAPPAELGVGDATADAAERLGFWARLIAAIPLVMLVAIAVVRLVVLVEKIRDDKVAIGIEAAGAAATVGVFAYVFNVPFLTAMLIAVMIAASPFLALVPRIVRRAPDIRTLGFRSIGAVGSAAAIAVELSTEEPISLETVVVLGFAAVGGYGQYLAFRETRFRAVALAAFYVALIALAAFFIGRQSEIVADQAWGGIDVETRRALIFYLVVLTPLSGAFYFLSLGLTRLLLRIGATLKPARSAALAAANLLLGGALFFGFAVCTILALGAVRLQDGSPLLSDEIVGAFSGDWWDNWWLYAVYVVAVMPAVYHVVTGVRAFFDTYVTKVARTADAAMRVSSAAALIDHALEARRKMAYAWFLGLIIGGGLVLGLVVAVAFVFGGAFLEALRAVAAFALGGPAAR